MPSLIRRRCIECGAMFDSVNERKTCSDECRRIRKNRYSSNAHKKNGKKCRGIIGSTAECKMCGAKFKVRGSKQVYCGSQCAKKARSIREKKASRRETTCSICGTVFMSSTKSIAKTCSYTCTAESRRRSMLAHYEENDFVQRYTPSDAMPCPWATPGKLGSGPEGVSWYSAQADPMTRGIWMSGNLETVRAREVAA